jgi:hypothetical protein
MMHLFYAGNDALVGSGTFVERQRHLSFLPFLVLDRVGVLLIIAPVV